MVIRRGLSGVGLERVSPIRAAPRTRKKIASDLYQLLL